MVFVVVWFYAALAFAIVIGTSVAIHDYVEDRKELKE
jgi:hypothetical protein